MKEEDIRPDAMMRECAALRQEDIRTLLEQRASFVSVDCPACEGSDHDSRFEKDGFDFVSCRDCETLFINPRPTQAMLRNLGA